MQIYGAYNIDNEVRKQSSSGGIFTLLVQYVLNKNGVVFAARFDTEFNVVHDYFENAKEINKFRGSKYVQSKMADIFKKIKEFLLKDRYVLFVGTPCQGQALKNYLAIEYNKLIICDLICHGTPKPEVWKEYVSHMESLNSSKIKYINFRDKTKSWYKYSINIEFENGICYKDEFMKNCYMWLFINDYILTQNCYKCRYTNTNRVGDFTIGDFWDVHERRPNLFDDKGTSLIFVNTKKAEIIFDTFKDNLKYEEITVEESMQKMLKEPASKPEKYDEFWNEYNKNGLISALEKIGFYNKPKE